MWLLVFVPIFAVAIAIIWDCVSNPYRIEMDVMGYPPKKVFFIYSRGPAIASHAHFYTEEEALLWIEQAKTLRNLKTKD